ncbi:hypothetical protein [Flavobacterium sp.]|uniref:hypothetical protein n=1 Tax=Flavobacterium sp. TaxID=239 RepID=UPI002B4AE337|nr:hypothetical protein [Flavobacterium sp.]HLP64108.1 hypothetical protein [Flavobacterium sp.]
MIGKNRFYTMRFEITFDEKISREQSKKYFELYWNDFVSKNNKRLFYIIPFVLIGITIIYGKSSLGYFFLLIGLLMLYLYFTNYRYYKKNKTLFNVDVEKHILNYSSNNKLCVWEFKEEQFCYSDFKFDLKINWSSFSKYRIIENDLILELRDNLIGNFFLNKEEVGAVHFDKIILFLEGKIKNN